MSMDKFKLMLKTLLSENFYLNRRSFFIHFIQLKLFSKKEFREIEGDLKRLIHKGMHEYNLKNFENQE